MRHHTKDKGDQGLGFVIGDLLHAGIQIALPLSEHLPFDLIAIADDGRLSRVQVKYRTAEVDHVTCKLRSSWADRNGSHTRPFDPGSCDAVAIYCPDPQLCCYIRTDEFSNGSLTLRLAPARNQ